MAFDRGMYVVKYMVKWMSCLPKLSVHCSRTLWTGHQDEVRASKVDSSGRWLASRPFWWFLTWGDRATFLKMLVFTA
jgi:hypothetical protein